MKHLVILCFVLGLAGCELGDRDNKRALGTLVGLGLGAAWDIRSAVVHSAISL